MGHRRRTAPRRTAVVCLLAATLAASACSSNPSGAPTTSEGASASPSTGQRSTTTSGANGSTPGSDPACDPADRIRSLPLRARAAQLVVVPSLDFELDGLAPTLASGVSGVLFLGRATAPEDLPDRIGQARTVGQHQVPMWFMADQEGGGVERVKGLVDPIDWPRTLADTLTTAEVEATAARVGEQLRAAGVDMDLAPVLDVDDRPGPSATNPAGRRSFGATADEVTAAGLAFARGLETGGVIPVVKHFPGLGRSTANTDNAAATTQPIDVLRTIDLLPFQAAIDAGLPAVMVANASVPGLTSQPATVAPEVVDGLLRTEMGFDGLVVTDSLSAVAITDAGYTLPEAAVASIVAGSDLILFGSTLDETELALLQPEAVAKTTVSIVEALIQAVGDETLTEERIDESVARILEVKGVDPCALGA